MRCRKASLGNLHEPSAHTVSDEPRQLPAEAQDARRGGGRCCTTEFRVLVETIVSLACGEYAVE